MINRIVWIVLGALVIIFVVIQFFQSPRNAGTGSEDTDLFSHAMNVSPEIRSVIRNSCYDCHSNTTHYPWYGRIAPVSWTLSSHIKEGKEHLNLSEWGTLSDRKKIAALQGMGEEVTKGEMPLKSYVLMHRKARLSADQKEQLLLWIDLESQRLIGQ